MDAEGYTVRKHILQEVVNPENVDYGANTLPFRLDAWRRTWDALQMTASTYQDEDLSKDTPNDDYQLLFVNILLKHTRGLLDAYEQNMLQLVKPLRIFLLGTAGTGKTRTVQTTLQEIHRLLKERHLDTLRPLCSSHRMRRFQPQVQ